MSVPFLLVLALWLLVTISLATPNCLCVFDVDRTLTGKQGDVKDCEGNREVNGVKDEGYGGGTMTLSVAGQSLNRTFCNDCYMGIVSAGIASGPGSKERATLVNMLNDGQHRVKNEWDDTCSYPVTSPLVLSCRDGTKQITVQGIVDWYGAINVKIAAGDVHFFDDRESNIAPFEDTAFNAHQISCATRDPSPGDKYNHPGTEGAVGFCGASVAEIDSAKGVSLCA